MYYGIINIDHNLYHPKGTAMLDTTFPILSVSSDGKVKHKNASAKSAFKMPKVNTYIHRYLDIGYDIAPYFSEEDECYGFIALDIPGSFKNSLCGTVWEKEALLMLMLPFIQQNTSTILWRTFRPIVLSIADGIFDIVLSSSDSIDGDFYKSFLNRSTRDLSVKTAGSIGYLYDKALAYGPYDIVQILDIFADAVMSKCRALRYSIDITVDKSNSGINREVEHPFFTLVFLELLMLSFKSGVFEHADVTLSLEYGRVSAKTVLHAKRNISMSHCQNEAGDISLIGKLSPSLALDAAICALLANKLDISISSAVTDGNTVEFESAMPLASLALPVRSHTLYPAFADDLRSVLEGMIY